VIGELGAGGAEKQLCYLVLGLMKRGYRPEVAVWDFDPDERFAARFRAEGVPVHPIVRRGGPGARAFRLWRLVRARRPVIAHSYSFFTNFFTWWAACGTSAFAVGSIRNSFSSELRGVGPLGGPLCARFPGRLIANSAAAATEAIGSGPNGRGRVLVVPNGIDTEAVQPAPLPDAGTFELLGLGRLYEQKRWQDCLKALRIVKSTTRVPWRLRLCGDGPLRGELEELRRRLDLEREVEFLGLRSDVDSLLASSHILVLSSGHEGMPNVVLEAMAAGRPVVATSVGDLPSLVRDGETGYLASPGDVAGLAARLIEAMADPERIRRMGLQARTAVESRFGVERLTERTLEAYASLGCQF
jgi:glycosyltransferase involved in cell wall biosynthesis